METQPCSVPPDAVGGSPGNAEGSSGCDGEGLHDLRGHSPAVLAREVLQGCRRRRTLAALSAGLWRTDGKPTAFRTGVEPSSVLSEPLARC